MSARDDAHGGRFEPAKRLQAGPGLPAVGRCDEFQADSVAGRHRVKVKRGPLRGILGMVCGRCMALRIKVAA